MDNVYKIKSDYIPDNQSEIKPCVLLLMDLQLDSWKGSEEDDHVIRLLIVDNSFCAIRKSYNVWCFSGNSSVSVRMIKKSHSKLISESWATAVVVSCRGVIVLRWRAICETASVSCRSFLSTKPLPRKFPSVSGGQDVALKQWALWRDSAQWAASPGGVGMWQRTCNGCHIVCPGSLYSRVCSSPGQGRGVLKGLSSSVIVGTWFSMSLTVLSFDTYVNLIRQVYELGARVVLCSRCGLAFLLRWIPLWTFAVFLERVLPIWLQVPLRTFTASRSIRLWEEVCGFIAFHQEAQISGFSHLQAVWRCHCGIYILL